jgi:hypothetical protein
MEKIGNFFKSFTQLFFKQNTFVFHRLVGLTYLLCYTFFLVYYFIDYNKWLGSPIFFCTPIIQMIQSISATLTFTFLPRSYESGFFSDKGYFLKITKESCLISGSWRIISLQLIQ